MSSPNDLLIKDKDKSEGIRRKRVEILVDNLGPKLLKRGQITDDPQYVKLLNDKRGVVREVKE